MAEIKAKPVLEIYNSDGYSVVEYINTETGKRFTASGTNLPAACTAILYGSFVKTKKYGEQFHVERYEEILSYKNSDIVDYITFLKLKGVGKTTAKRIVDAYGKDSYEAIKDTEKLSRIKGIGKVKAEEIRAEYNQKKELRYYYEYGDQFGLCTRQIQLLYEQFSKEEDGLELLKKRPYLMCSVEGVSFITIDNAMKKMPDFTPFHPDRLTYGIYYIVFKNETDGHVFCLKEWLLAGVYALLNQNVMCDENELVRVICMAVNDMVRSGKLIYSYGVIYRKAMYQAECDVSKKLLELMKVPLKHPVSVEKVWKTISEVEAEKGLQLSDKQRQGVACALLNNVSIITGGPGRGKTTLLRVLLACEMRLRKKNVISLCAPSGRAARMMEENAESPASTIHSLLQIRQEDYHQNFALEPLESDVVIMDETSMCGMELMANLISCINYGTRLVFIGDKDQLPSVQAGRVFADLIASGVIPTVILDKAFRQAEDSSIIKNGDKVNENDLPLVYDDSFAYIRSYNEDNTFDALMDSVNKLLAGGIKWDDIQILTPFKTKTKLGCVYLNQCLQNVFNPAAASKSEMHSLNRILREGDRVIHLKNEGDVNNGDMGTIIEVYTSDRMVTVRFETGIIKTYESAELSNLQHAYALTVHKSQGSEYKAVVMPFISIFGRMRVRNLLYTAITRAKEKFVLIGNEKDIAYAASIPGNIRNSFLAYRLATGAKIIEKNEVYEQGKLALKS